jgi:hypothetical protein
MDSIVECENPTRSPHYDLTRKYRNAGVYIVRSKQKLYAARWGEAVNPGPHFEWKRGLPSA